MPFLMGLIIAFFVLYGLSILSRDIGSILEDRRVLTTGVIFILLVLLYIAFK